MKIKNIIIFLLFPMVVFTSCQNKEQATKTPKKQKLPLVKVQKVKVQKMASSITIIGTVEPNAFSDIVSPVDGVIDELRARENQQVKKGAIIAVINTNERVSLIAKHQLRVEQLQKRLQTLNKDSKDYSEVKNNLEKALSDLEFAKNMYQTIPVICPINGMVTNRLLDVGAQVKTKDKILTITDMSSLVIKTQVNEKYFTAIKKGRKLPLKLNAYPNDSLTGVISLVYPKINVDTRSIYFDIRIQNFHQQILPGMMATITLGTSIHDNTLVIPDDAILTDISNKPFIFRIDSDTIARKLYVTLGLSSNGFTEITSGLSENDNIVVKGQEMLKDGGKVLIAESINNSKK